MNSWNVLMVAPTSFFGDYGCHVRILEEATILQKLGHRVTIVTYYKGRDLAGLNIARTWPIPWRENYEVGSSRHKIGFDVFLTAKALAVARRLRPDIIHGHLHEGAAIGWAIGRAVGAPLVFDYQGSLTAEMLDHGFLKRDGRFYEPMRRLEGWINHRPAAIITSTQMAAEQCRQVSEIAGRVVAVPDCVNADTFRPGLLNESQRAALKAQLGIPADRTVVVYLGLLAPYQGTGLLLEAAARLVAQGRNVHFLVMGYPGEGQYREMARQLGAGDHVTFTGRMAYELAPQHLALGDIAVAPKLSSSEGSGKLLNYMAMGLPTVAFDTPASREYLADDGVYARKGDVASLADCLDDLLLHEERALEIGRRLRARAVAEYAWERAGEKIVEVYEAVARRRTDTGDERRTKAVGRWSLVVRR